MYSKRGGTSGIRGQLYESKLLSLIYFRAIHDDNIDKFHLGTNIDHVGAFDDICFKARLKGFERPIAAFVQAKHRENDKIAFNNKKDLAKYFYSYLNIKHAFKPNNKDAFFDGIFDETECIFAMYTTAKDDFENASVESSYASYLYDLIGTGGFAKLPYKKAEDVEFLCKVAMKEQITSLAVLIGKFIYDEGNLQTMLNDDLILLYHVILAQKVLHVSDVQPDGHRDATFRRDFFDTNEEFLVLLKHTIYMEVLQKRKLGDNEGQKLLLDFIKDSSQVTILSKLIGTVIIYNNGKLELISKTQPETLKLQLQEVYVPQSAVNQAVELAAKEILLSKGFKVPTSFGNKDLTIRGKDDKIEKRLNHLSSRLIDLLDNSKSNNIVTIDESLESGFLKLNGGIAGAVGNILVHDEDTKLIKFTDKCGLLGDLAKRLYDKLISAIPNLHEYKFNVKVDKFPKLSFDYGVHEESLARDFLNKLLYYTNQADENVVEEILKREIEDDHRNYVNSFQVKTDAIFLNFHDAIQKWWMEPEQAPYLTKKSKIFENSINNIVKDPLMSVIHAMYTNKMNNISYTFSAAALTSLKLQDQKSTAVIVAESSALTVAKVMQYLNNKDHVVLDLEYILNLPINDRNTLRAEINTNQEKTLILVCDKIQNSVSGYKTLQNIAKAVQNKSTIVVTNRLSVEIIKKHFLQIDNVVHDERNNLIDLSEESQRSILESALVIFQGKEVSLNVVLDDESKACVEGDVLNRIINKETIVVGKPIENSNYVERRVKKNRNEEDIVLKTLYDIKDDVVLVTAKPGMGKSTLLTHISFTTKELDPKLWIIRVNLLEYSREFSKWKENKTVIDLLETLNFMCQVILREKLGKNNKVEIALEEVNGSVYLRECTGDQWTVFELKLFLHYFNKETLIFLFDGFDEICPHYTNEVLKCLKTVRNYHRKHRMWVTSRSYNDIKTILQREFGTSYEMECFTFGEREMYLESFWNSNFTLKDFDIAQLENVRGFLEFMSETVKQTSDMNRFPLLFVIYIYGGHFLINEIKYTYLPLWKYNTSIDDTYYIKEKALLKIRMSYMEEMGPVYADKTDGIPLHLYLTVDYFIRKLEEVDKSTNKWNLNINTFTIYEHFLETKLKTIRFQQKNAMDMYNPDIKIFYNKERADFVIKHKKLAIYAIFRQHSHKLFTKSQIKRIKDTIRFIEKGGEKTGLINTVENHMPIFVHMTFAEHFAVDYLCDLLKKEDSDKMKQSIMDLIFNVTFLQFSWGNIRKLLDYKMKIDKRLIKIFDKNKKLIFDCIMGRYNKKYLEHNNTLDEHDIHPVGYNIEGEIKETRPFEAFYSSLSLATLEHLENHIRLFVSVLKTYLTEDNFNDFLTTVKKNHLITTLLYEESNVLIKFIIEIIKRFVKNIRPVLCDMFPMLPSSENYDGMTSEQILEKILLGHKEYVEFISRMRPEPCCNDNSQDGYW